MTTEPPPSSGRILVSLDRRNTKTVSLPRIVHSHYDFVNSVRRIREALAGEEPEENNFLQAMYYLLGFMVGDAMKHPSSERRLTMGLRLQLTKKHPDNIQLGEYMMGCLRKLGIKYSRGRDGKPRKKVPNGFYSWHSENSAAIGWLFTACLGLKWNQRTTRDPVRMKWVLTAPQRYRKCFLRGLADSDGGIQFHHRRAEIVSSPNTEFVKALFNSLELRTLVKIQRGYGYVSVSVADAARIKLFNPDISTHRRMLLEKLANARAYSGRWPAWLQSRVAELIHQGLGSRKISEILLEGGVFVRPRTINIKRRLTLRSESDSAPAHPKWS